LPSFLFRDIFPVLRNPDIFKDLMDILFEHIKEKAPGVQVIVGLEARGFLFGPILAQRLNCSFVPIRKKGKLPGETESVEYSLEYGTVIKSGNMMINMKSYTFSYIVNNI
jgi:adenine phosphoribosyltransferase